MACYDGDAAESAQGSATITDVVAIRGGGIPVDQSIQCAWLVQPEEIDGRRFMKVSTQDGRCRLYFGGNFGMVNHIKKLRDLKTLDLMRAAAHEGEDPNASFSDPTNNNKLPERPKRELIDLIPKIIDIDVSTNNGIQATVSVIPNWRDRAVLQIELIQENMDLLLEAPPAESAPFNPNLEGFPDVKWVVKRSHVRCSYWDSKHEMWKMHSQRVEFAADDTPEDKDVIVTVAAAAVQEFHKNHHNLANNCSCEPRGEGEPSLKRQKSKEIMSAGSA